MFSSPFLCDQPVSIWKADSTDPDEIQHSTAPLLGLNYLPLFLCGPSVYWLQSFKQFFFNVSYHIYAASLTLRAIRVRLATGICYDKLMKNCFKDCSQSRPSALMVYFALTLCILETPKQVFWQTVKTLMKCSIMLHFIRVCTVCKD